MSDFSEINADDLYFKINEYKIIDVREPYEYDAGHISGSVNIPLSVLQVEVKRLNLEADSSLVMVCRSGTRSENACKILSKDHRFKLSNLIGGVIAWNEAGYALQR